MAEPAQKIHIGILEIFCGGEPHIWVAELKLEILPFGMIVWE